MWLCGPYGTGVCWLRPELRDALRPTKLYWLSALTAEDLAAPSLDLEAVRPRRAGRFDACGAASSFNDVPFTAAVELLLELGIEEVGACVDGLVTRLLAGIDPARFRLASSARARSALAVVEPLAEPAGAELEL